MNHDHRRRRPRYTRTIDDDVAPPLPPRFPQQYAYDGYNVSIPLSMTPPPPYEAYGNSYTAPPQPFYQQPIHSQPYLPVPVQMENRLRKKPSAQISTLDVSKQRNGSPYRQEHGAWHSSANLPVRTKPSRFDDCPIVSSMVQGAALCDRVADMVHDALSRLDCEEEDEPEELNRRPDLEEVDPLEKTRGGSIIDFRKTWFYSNSRLPPHLPPMKIYLPTWQIICSAAQASMDVYRRPRKDEVKDYVEADWRLKTKAMVIKSRPIDDKNQIVIAIRGSRWNIVDWAVNFHPAPSEPRGFLDDEGNACHAGFLQVARAMVSPIAARLRDLLEQNPSRASSSLVLTGHSAGGAVASLLYMHMMATSFESELNILTGCFKRVHCVTFGTPPLSLLPLQNPAGNSNVFFHFANEGDPVVRADRQYLRTLTSVIARPSPLSSSTTSTHNLRGKLSRQTLKNGASASNQRMPIMVEVPPATLSNAGQMVLLREKPGQRGVVEAVKTTDDEIRSVLFGHVEMHHMDLYKRRIDELAIAAVTGRG